MLDQQIPQLVLVATFSLYGQGVVQFDRLEVAELDQQLAEADRRRFCAKGGGECRRGKEVQLLADRDQRAGANQLGLDTPGISQLLRADHAAPGQQSGNGIAAGTRQGGVRRDRLNRGPEGATRQA